MANIKCLCAIYNVEFFCDNTHDWDSGFSRIDYLLEHGSYGRTSLSHTAQGSKGKYSPSLS